MSSNFLNSEVIPLDATNEEIQVYRNKGYKILENDKWTCQITSQIGGNLNVHHLDGYNWCKDKRLDIKNGITLSHEIHNEFHSIYGKGDNTTEQFIDYVNNKHNKNEISNENYLKLIKRLNENKQVQTAIANVKSFILI